VTPACGVRTAALVSIGANGDRPRLAVSVMPPCTVVRSRLGGESFEMPGNSTPAPGGEIARYVRDEKAKDLAPRAEAELRLEVCDSGVSGDAMLAGAAVAILLASYYFSNAEGAIAMTTTKLVTMSAQATSDTRTMLPKIGLAGVSER